MKLVDKISAKKLGISVEEYREKVKIAQEIWNNLYMERKIIDPSLYCHKDIRLSLVDFMFDLVVLFLLVLVVTLALGLEVTRDYLYLCILSCVLYLIGRFFIYKHDIKQFDKRVEEIAEMEKECREVEEYKNE